MFIVTEQQVKWQEENTILLRWYIIILIIANQLFALDLSESRGLLRLRSQFPIGVQFLALPAETAFNISKGSFLVELEYDHSNTFAMSDGVLNEINSDDQPAEFNPDYPNNGNEYFIDTEIIRINLNMQYGLSDNISIGIDVPIIVYQGGFMDSPIGLFHNTFGIENYNRSRSHTNYSTIYLSSKQNQYSRQEGYGIGDAVLSIKTRLFQSANKLFNLTLLSAGKLPTGNYQRLTGSGSLDYGFNLIITNILKRHLITNNFSFVFPGQWKLFPEIKIRNVYAWMIGYELTANSHWSFIFQHRIQTSPVARASFTQAAKPAFEWSAGIKADLWQSYRIALGFTQNYINHENVPDFGFHVGIQKIF